MNSFNNEVCEFDSTPTTENFDESYNEIGKCRGVSWKVCESRCKNWSYNHHFSQYECYDDNAYYDPIRKTDFYH